MKISIITATYNSGKTVRDTFKKVLPWQRAISFFLNKCLQSQNYQRLLLRMTSGCGRKGKDLWNSFSRTSRRLICNVTFKLPNGEKKTVQGKEGESVLQVAHRNEIPLEGMNANLSRVDISRCRCLWRISRLRYLSHSPRPKDVRQASRAKWGRRRPFGFRSWIDWDVWVLSKENQK